MILLRGRIDLSPSLLEFEFKNRVLQMLFGSLPFYYLRMWLFKHTPLRGGMIRRTIMNERIAEYPYVFHQIARYPGIQSVLDIGSAFSLMPIQLATLGYKVTGLDIIDSGDSHHPNFNQVVSDLFEHKLPKESFDCVVSVSTIEHMGFGAFGDKVIPDADVKAFQIVHELLKSGGIAIITVPAGSPTNEWLKHWWDKTTNFTKERVALVTKDFEILDQRLLGKKSKQGANSDFEYFIPEPEIRDYNVHLLTLRKRKTG